MDPVIGEICRAREVKPQSLFKWQRYLQHVIQPKLDRLAALEAAAAAEPPAKRTPKAVSA